MEAPNGFRSGSIGPPVSCRNAPRTRSLEDSQGRFPRQARALHGAFGRARAGRSADPRRSHRPQFRRSVRMPGPVLGDAAGIVHPGTRVRRHDRGARPRFPERAAPQHRRSRRRADALRRLRVGTQRRCSAAATRASRVVGRTGRGLARAGPDCLVRTGAARRGHERRHRARSVRRGRRGAPGPCHAAEPGRAAAGGRWSRVQTPLPDRAARHGTRDGHRPRPAAFRASIGHRPGRARHDPLRLRTRRGARTGVSTIVRTAGPGGPLCAVRRRRLHDRVGPTELPAARVQLPAPAAAGSTRDDLGEPQPDGVQSDLALEPCRAAARSVLPARSARAPPATRGCRLPVRACARGDAAAAGWRDRRQGRARGRSGG